MNNTIKLVENGGIVPSPFERMVLESGAFGNTPAITARKLNEEDENPEIARHNAEIDREVKQAIHHFVVQFYNSREIEDFYADLNEGYGKNYVKRFFRELSGSIRILAPRHYTADEIIEMMKEEAEPYLRKERNPYPEIGHFM